MAQRAGVRQLRRPGVSGQWSLDHKPANAGGPVLWIEADQLGPALLDVRAHGGTVHGNPHLDQGARWLVEVHDPAGPLAIPVPAVSRDDEGASTPTPLRSSG